MEILTAIETDLVAPNQVGWVYFQEGDAVIAAKICATPSGQFYAVLPTSYRQGVSVFTVYYRDRELWNKNARALVAAFYAHREKERL